MITISVLSSLENVKRMGSGWTARCPAHNDAHNSLSISEGKGGQLLLYCHAGCTFERIVAAIEPRGRPESKRVVKTYDYEDENGQLLYQVCRTEPKGFFVRRPNGEGGYINGLGDVQRVLYRLPELLEADPRITVFITEGEKDADALCELGLLATCNASGAGKWREEYTESLRGRPVVILPDNDEPGRNHAETVAHALHGVAESVRVVNLPDLPEKGDVSDWLEAGHNAEELLAIVEAAPLRTITRELTVEAESATTVSQDSTSPLVRMSDVVREAIYWLWFPFIALGKLTIIEGEEGVGKSWLVYVLAAIVSTGRGFPPHFERFEAGNVLILSAEDDRADTIKPRLDACGADTSRIHAVRDLLVFDEKGLLQLESYIAEIMPKLVIVDPLFAYTPPRTDINSANQSRAISARLAQMAAEYECAFLLVRHIGKAKGNGDPRAAGLGSIDWRAAVRSALLVGKNPANESERAIVQTKNNLAPPGNSIGFTIEGNSEGAQFMWTGLSTLTASQILANVPDEDARAEQLDAVEFLREALRAGAQEAGIVISQAADFGITTKRLRTAREKLGVIVRKHGGGFDKEGRQFWTWELPDA